MAVTEKRKQGRGHSKHSALNTMHQKPARSFPTSQLRKMGHITIHNLLPVTKMPSSSQDWHSNSLWQVQARYQEGWGIKEEPQTRISLERPHESTPGAFSELFHSDNSLTLTGHSATPSPLLATGRNICGPATHTHVLCNLTPAGSPG